MGLFSGWSKKPERKKADPAPVAPAVAGASSEADDAKLVDKAAEFIQGEHFRQAAILLEDVLSRAPADYRHEEEKDGKSYIRFWQLDEFLAYVVWMKANGTERELVWISNAYPRAAYYLAYLSVERKAFDKAMEYLERGLKLDPDSPRLNHEKAQVYLRTKRTCEGLALYQSLLAKPNFFIVPADRAMLLRGKGYAEIELGDLDTAEASLRQSLELDPESSVAKNELAFIEQERRKRG
jgi:Tfp pilus assembly protein PilF